MSMYDKLDEMLARFEDIERQAMDPDVASDPTRYTRLMRERGGLDKIVTAYRELLAARDELEQNRSVAADEANDAELRELAEAEIPDLEQRVATLESGVQELLVTEDETGVRDAVLEIRAGAGGDEAALFARELLDLYRRWAENRGWTTEMLEMSATDLGGVRAAVMMVRGTEVFKHLQFEGGGHRVQRVPETEKQGRIQTSLCTVAVFPEAEESDVEINDEDVKVDRYCASGPGGQHVNKTETAIRLTHLPTGIVVQCQDEKSQHKNLRKARKILLSRVFDHHEQERKAAEDAERRAMIGSGDRSQRIRTYNFPQNRLTDHRVSENFTLDRVWNDGLDDVVEVLLEARKVERLQAL